MWDDVYCKPLNKECTDSMRLVCGSSTTIRHDFNTKFIIFISKLIAIDRCHLPSAICIYTYEYVYLRTCRVVIHRIHVCTKRKHYYNRTGILCNEMPVLSQLIGSTLKLKFTIKYNKLLIENLITIGVLCPKIGEGAWVDIIQNFKYAKFSLF